MIINSLSTAGIASSVWSQAARTLTNQTGVWNDTTRNLTNPSGVFNDASRSLTNVGAWVAASIQNGSIAASSTASLQPAAGHLLVINLGVHAAAAGSVDMYVGDGTNICIIATAATGTQVGLGQVIAGNAASINARNNDAANTAHYCYAGYNATM
jgi:hypothetical protein